MNCSYSSGITLLHDMEDEYYYRQLREYFPHIPKFEIVWSDADYADVNCRKTGKPLLVMQLEYEI